MSCPAFEDCNKKPCIEQSVCMNAEYWAEYWKKIVAIRKEEAAAQKKDRKKALRILHFKNMPACVKIGDWCDKKDSCAVLGQCIVTIPRIAANPALMEALKGTLGPGAVIKRLRQHDPEPMASYYTHQDRLKK